MDGFMAATKILSHFNNKDRYFPDLDSFNQKNENSNEGMKSKIKEYYRSAIVRRQSNSRDISVDEGSPHALGQSINDVMAIKPLIVACSNLMNDSIKQQCKEAGFDICL